MKKLAIMVLSVVVLTFLFVGCSPAETCSDDILNQDEEGVDCGGSYCKACPEPEVQVEQEELQEDTTQDSTTPLEKPVGVECFETDKGIDYNTKGRILDKNDEEFEDICQGTRLKEYYCDTYGYAKDRNYLCEGECEDGACVQGAPEDTNCIDSDGGLAYDKLGSTTNKRDGTVYWDECRGNTIEEYFCTTFDYVDSKTYLCEGVCLEGACIGVPEVNKLCFDTDNGISYNTPGIVTDSRDNETFEDYCKSTFSLEEYYCDTNDYPDSKIKLCDNVCSDGACV
ncbi:hypothetical protein GOV04_04815 [Candidatus Woesearchaeota archaeon]|nr:hypothetical protein [Candidatus Woesearchaeota archaeon]